MKAQELFDKSVGALLKQRRKSVKKIKGDTICSYRSKVGCCAVGHLIPDDKYNEQMDCEGGINSTSLLREFPELKEYLLPSDMQYGEATYFLTELQMIHDSKHPNSWKNQFKLLAESYGLQWNFN